MADQQLSAAVRHIRRLAATHHKDRTDRDLLAAFATRNDQAAFTTLVKRHGPMVMGICRRFLQHLQDAEDAFQATFILLARRSAGIRKQESLASWLHGVAYRMVQNAKRSASRRRKYEGTVQPAQSINPTAALEWREVQTILDDEIQRLPEMYRTPFILFYLENRNHADIARQVGRKEGTVGSRLAHARRLLQEGLSRRGVALPAVLGLLAVSAEGATAAISGPLVSSVVQTAMHSAAGGAIANVASAKVSALVQGAQQAMTLGKLKMATLLLFAAGVVGTGFGFTLHRPQAVQATEMGRDQSPQAQPASVPAQADAGVPDKKESKAKEVVDVRGRVLDPDGRPVAGAKLYLGSRDKVATYPLRATSDGGGRFTFRYPLSGSPTHDSAAHSPPLKVLAVARGYGCAWGSVGSADKELTLRLVKDVAVSGRIADADGKPVANAQWTVDGVAAFAGAKKSGIVFAHTLPYTDYPSDAANGWLGPLPDQGIALTTSADGRFKLTGVGPDRIVSLHLEAPGIATTDLGVISGTPVQLVAIPSRPIRGVVRDKTTGQPLAGASVFVSGLGAEPIYEEPRWGKTVTDKEGRYELLGLTKPPKYNLKVQPARGQLYFQREVELMDTPGLAALVADIDMVQGVTVRGKVTDKGTHKPIAQARVVYYPLWGSPNGGREAQCSGANTEPDGSYALTVHPGPGVIGVICRNPDAYMSALVTTKEFNDSFTFALPAGNNEMWLQISLGQARPLFQANYNALVLLEPQEGNKALVKDIALERALERKGRVVGPDGQPIPGVTVTALSPGQWGQLTETLEGTEFTVRRINPRAKRLITFHHKEKNLGYCLKELPDEKLGLLTIKLQPCGSISGRIVDPDGIPVVANKRVYVQGVSGLGATVQNFTLDKEGRFHVKGLLPGLEYNLMDNKRAFIVREGVMVEPGKHKDLGDIQVSDN